MTTTVSLRPSFFEAFNCTTTQYVFGIVAVGLLLSFHPPAAFAQLEFEDAPIRYGKGPTNDPITEVQKRLDMDKATLEFDADHGYLRSVHHERCPGSAEGLHQ